MEKSFALQDDFVSNYTHDPFGFNGLGLTVFYRTYSRQKDDGTMESWADVCRRVIEWMFSVQKNRMKELGKYWDEEKAQSSAKDAYDRMYNLKWSPPGRGLWLAGSDFIYKRNKVEALNNCAFISTKDIQENPGEIFGWIMDYLMLGVGVGYDIRGANKIKIQSPTYPKEVFIIPDSREGWVESVIHLVDSYMCPGKNVVTFDYSQIRAKGEKINGFGGTSSGYEPLKKLHERIDNLFIGREGEYVSATDIADVSNMIAGCVIAGNVRRSAQIILGTDEKEFLDLKNYAINPQREEWGWASNNSVIVDFPDSVDYSEIADRIFRNGEPGLFWQNNVRNFGRMGEQKKDNAIGTNPCAEQPLESYEMCTLTEVYLGKHKSVFDLMKTIKFAYLYAKSVSLTNDMIEHPKTREVMTRNRRIGLSLTGVAQFLDNHSLTELIEWMKTGYSEVQRYDNVYSAWLDIPKSVRTTTIKPSGTVSLLAGSTPGIHFPMSRYYIRRIRISEDSPLVELLYNAGYHIEQDVYSDNTLVISYPVDSGARRSEKDVSPWEQLKLASVAQKYWSDNGVSITVKFDPQKTTKNDLKAMLEHYQHELKAVSFLPDVGTGAYAQMPYESIDQARYSQMTSGLKQIDFAKLSGARDMADLYCDGDACMIPV